MSCCAKELRTGVPLSGGIMTSKSNIYKQDSDRIQRRKYAQICTDLVAETKNQNTQIYNAVLGNIAMYEDHAMQALLQSPSLLYQVLGLCHHHAIYESLHDSPTKVLHTVAG